MYAASFIIKSNTVNNDLSQINTNLIHDNLYVSNYYNLVSLNLYKDDHMFSLLYCYKV